MTQPNLALVVEDSPELRMFLGALFRHIGMDVITARDGESALRLAQETRPRIICLDLMLPTISGLEVCQALKGNTETARIPVMMVSARNFPQDRAAAHELGADIYLTKPVDKDDFLAAVRSILWQHRTTTNN